MMLDPRKEPTLQERLKLLEEEGRQKDRNEGDRTLTVIVVIILVGLILVTPAMVNFFLNKPAS